MAAEESTNTSPTEIVFAREGWIPRVIRNDATLYLTLGAGADANHDPRTFTLPISEAHLEIIRTNLTRHLLLWSAILPLCDDAGTGDPLDEAAAIALLDPILFSTEAEVKALFKEIKWDKRQLIAQGAAIDLLEKGDVFAALQSAGLTSNWNLVWEYDANRNRARRGVKLSPLDTALLKYTDRYLHGGKAPLRKPDAVDPSLLPEVLAVITTAETACAGMELSPDWRNQKEEKEWDVIKEKVEQTLRKAYPSLVDDAVETVSFLMCAEAADRAKKRVRP